MSTTANPDTLTRLLEDIRSQKITNPSVITYRLGCSCSYNNQDIEWGEFVQVYGQSVFRAFKDTEQ